MEELQKLANAFHSNKLSHAYLFEGDDAQSMKYVAMEFAQLILCNGNEQCELKLRNFNHPDFTYISSEESTIKKEQIEQLVRQMNQLPIEGTYKVYIIEDFEKLTVQGENSILKFLEEPPENTIAILISTKPEQILNTIHSRCQHMYFKPSDTSHFIDKLVDNGINRAIAEMLSSYTTQIEVAKDLNEEYDLIELRKVIVHWCELLLTNKPMALISVIDVLKNAKNRKLQLLTLSVINAFFEDMMHAKVGIENNFIFTDLKPLIKEYTTRLTLNQMILMYDQIIEAHKKLIQNVNPMLVFEQIVIKGVS